MVSRAADMLRVRAWCALIRDRKLVAAGLLQPCRLDYEEKNDTAYITITAPPNSYYVLKMFNNSKAMELYITPEKLDPKVTQNLREDYLVVRSIYQALDVLVIDAITGIRNLKFRTNNASEMPELHPQKTENTPPEPSVNNQCRQFDNNNPVHIWENLRFRSHSEIRIAQALDRRKVLFLPNCAARLGFSRRQNREADFLVCDKGKWGILEVDTPDSHPPARTVEDHERARLFQAHGILLVQHFDGGDCFEYADGVVDKFLYLLRNQK